MLITHGPDIYDTLVTIIIDTYLHEIGANHDALTRRSPDTNYRVVPMFVNQRESIDVDDVSPHIVWASRLLVARAAWDPDNWTALLRSAQDEGRLGSGLFALLHIVGSGLRDHWDGHSMTLMTQHYVPAIPDSPEGLV